MTAAPDRPGAADPADEDLLADLFDHFLQEILEGRTPDLAAVHPGRQDLRERIARTWALACSVAGRRVPSQPVLGGYEVQRELGHGGMGTVYLARHLALQRDVAIKVLPHSLAMSPRAKQRFLEEARALARIRHDHVVHVHRILDHAEMLAFEMEYVAGPSLQALIAALRQAPRPHRLDALAAAIGCAPAALGCRTVVEWAVRLGIRMARALGEVHRHGLVHRDVKPANVLLRPDGQPVLADFGLARDGEPLASQTGRFAGTPVYAAPERLRGGDAALDARADVYGLGVTLYELLALETPFAGSSSTHDVLRRIEQGQLPRLRRIAPHVSRDLETVVGKAMETDPRHRYATADEFADDLERLLALQPIQARPAGPLRRAVQLLRRQQRTVLAAAAGAALVAALAWPLAGAAEAAAAARATAAAARQQARLAVLSLEALPDAWAGAFAGAGRQPLRAPRAREAQLQAFDAALRHYAAAGAAQPDDAALQLERQAIAAARAVRGGAAGPAAGAGLPPLLRAVLARQDAAPPAALDGRAAAPAERFAAGLLAFLLGDAAGSAQCWRDLDAGADAAPLLEACRALQLAGDGFAERAYPHLFHAARAFPTASALALALADAALAMGDVPAAETWLRGLPAGAATGLRPRLLQGDLAAARGDGAAARAAYLAVAAAEPTNPLPRQRLAALALARGELATARRLLEHVLAQWPQLAAARFDYARLLLLQRDLPGYLAQVRHVLAAAPDAHSPGSFARLRGVLALGGLATPPARGGDPPGQPFAVAPLPVAGFVPAARLGAIEQALPLVCAFDDAHRRALEDDPRELAAALRAAAATLLGHPALLASLPPRLAAAAVAGLRLGTGAAADLLAALRTRHQRVLGDRLHHYENPPLAQSGPLAATQNYGLSVARGDFDGDSLAEAAVAVADGATHDNHGAVQIVGLDFAGPRRELRNPDGDRSFARALANAGDLDGDRADDLLVGAPVAGPGTGLPGQVQLWSGATGRLLWSLDHPLQSFGAALAALDDLDGDGCRDFAVGAPPLRLGGAVAARAFVASGRDGRILREHRPDRADVWFGAAVAAAGDLDGDGLGDLVVGGSYGGAPGLVQVFSGRRGDLLRTFGDDDPKADFGAALLGVGDADGDGRADLAIGAPARSSRGQQPGKVVVVDGATGAVRYELAGERPGDQFGRALAVLPDWLANGRAVLAVGAARGGPIGTGYVRIVDLATGQPVQTFVGLPQHASYGHSLVDLGDLDGDGWPDLGATSVLRQGTGQLLQLSWAPLAAPAARRR